MGEELSGAEKVLQIVKSAYNDIGMTCIRIWRQIAVHPMEHLKDIAWIKE